jgi:hypothetical protein
MNSQEINTTAERRANEKFGFYMHLMVFVIINTMLTAINLLTNTQFLWFIYPLFGWGAAILIHAASMLMGRSLKDRLLEHEIEELSHIKN